MKLTVRCREFKSVPRNTLAGFAVILIEELRLNIKDVAVHVRGNRRWAQLPAKPVISREGLALRDATTGKITYVPLLQFTDRATSDAFSDRVIAAVLEHSPGALNSPPRQPQASANPPTDFVGNGRVSFKKSRPLGKPLPSTKCRSTTRFLGERSR
jgi:hypothetical protein